MVSALDSDRAVRVLVLCRGHCVVFLGKTLTVPLSTQVGEFNAGGNPAKD